MDVDFRVTVYRFANLKNARRGHSCINIGRNILLVVGGESSDQLYLSSVEILDLNLKISRDFEMSKPLLFHQCVPSCIDNNSVMLLGGFDGFLTIPNLGVLNYKTGKYEDLSNGTGKQLDAFSMTHFYRNKRQHHNLTSSLFPNRISSPSSKKKSKKIFHLKKHRNPKKRKKMKQRFQVEEEEGEEDQENLSTGHSFLVFGGWDGVSVRYNHLYEYNVDRKVFKRIFPESSVIPSGRTGHTAVMWNNQELVIFGGNDGKKRLQDTYSFDLRTRMWKKWETTGFIPSRRSGHSAKLFNRHKMIVVGGFTGKLEKENNNNNRDGGCIFILNLATKNWKKVVVSNNHPFSDVNHLPKLLSNPTLSENKQQHLKRKNDYFSEQDEWEYNNDYFYVVGGYDVMKGRCTSDILKIHVYDEKVLGKFGWKMMKKCNKFSDCVVVLTY